MKKSVLITIIIVMFSGSSCKDPVEPSNNKSPEILFNYLKNSDTLTIPFTLSVNVTYSTQVDSVVFQIDPDVYENSILGTSYSSSNSFRVIDLFWGDNKDHNIMATAFSGGQKISTSPIKVYIRASSKIIPTPVKPLDETLVDTSIVRLEWGAVSGAMKYEVGYYQGDTLTNLNIVGTTTETHYDLTINKESTWYLWCVRSYNGNNKNGPWSSYLKFYAIGSDKYSRKYHGNGSILAIENTSDGGAITLGWNNAKLWLMKINRMGKKLWERYFGNEPDHSMKLAIDSDREIWIVYSNPTGFHIIKTDIEGNQFWEKVIGEDLFTPIAIVKIPSSYPSMFMVAANTGSNGWLLKMNQQGDTVWSKLVFGTQSMNIGAFCAGPQNYNYQGQTFLLGNTLENRLSLVSSKIDTVWTRNVSDSPIYAFKGSSNYYVALSTDILAVDYDSKIVWQKTIAGVSSFEKGMILTNNIYFPVLTKFSLIDGSIEWNKTIQFPSGELLYTAEFLRRGKTGWLISGMTDDGEPFVIKVDDQGESIALIYGD